MPLVFIFILNHVSVCTIINGISELSSFHMNSFLHHMCVMFYIHSFPDNVFAIKSWAKKKFGFENSNLDKAFGIPEDFDYIN